MDCPPPLVSMDMVALPNEDGSVFVVSTGDTDTRLVVAAYDLRLDATVAAVNGDVDFTNRRAGPATLRYQWSRAIDEASRPKIPEGSPVCYDYEASRLVVQIECSLAGGEQETLPLEWSVNLHPAADINQDGKVDAADQGILFSDWGKDNPRSDLDRDGKVGGSDLGILNARWGWEAPWNQQP